MASKKAPAEVIYAPLPVASIIEYADAKTYGYDQDYYAMNLFFLDRDPVRCAAYHCDRHVVKMILEIAQLLSTAWHVLHNEQMNGVLEPKAKFQVIMEKDDATHKTSANWYLNGKRVYSPTHRSHPTAVWVRSSSGAYRYTHQLGVALCDEYRHRYGKVHATRRILDGALRAVPQSLARTGRRWEEPPCVMPEELTIHDGQVYDAVESYRNYYLNAKVPLLTWSRRPTPDWVVFDDLQVEETEV